MSRNTLCSTGFGADCSPIDTSATTVLSITPPTQAQIITKQVKQTVRTTPAIRTVTTTLTSTAFVDPNGQTIAMRKRNEPTPVQLAERAIATPPYLKGMSKAGIRAACQCLEIPTPTITQRKTALATGQPELRFQ